MISYCHFYQIYLSKPHRQIFFIVKGVKHPCAVYLYLQPWSKVLTAKNHPWPLTYTIFFYLTLHFCNCLLLIFSFDSWLSRLWNDCDSWPLAEFLLDLSCVLAVVKGTSTQHMGTSPLVLWSPQGFLCMSVCPQGQGQGHLGEEFLIVCVCIDSYPECYQILLLNFVVGKHLV